MTSPALNRRTRRGLNKRLRRHRDAPLRIVEWKTIVLREWDENGVKHNSHKHAFSITCVNEETHVHTHDTDEDSGGDGYCGIGVNHHHSITVDAGEAHNHVFSGYTGLTTATDLNHTHTISITSQTGSMHKHDLSGNFSSSFCTADGCEANPHLHAAGGSNANESSHNHGLNGNTGNGTGLLRWHKHSVSLTSGAGSSHTHLVGSPTISEVSCHTGYLHDHGDGVEESSAESAHVHDVLGDTEDEGEPVDGSADLLGKFDVGQDSAELLGKFEAQDTAELLGKTDITHSAELLSNFRVSCSRRLGGNWQRKMWFDGTYYWRGRYDPTDNFLKFEWIAAAGLAGNVWTENLGHDAVTTRIDASAFTGIDADFTVRGGESGIPTTIHYSDGIDTWVAESDEDSLTGWAWENLTKIFDGETPDWYRRVNLCANRTTPTPRLWAIAVFYDQSSGKQWVKARRQTTGGDITGWDGEVDVSNVDNTATLYGCSARSMGDAGPLKNDIMVVYKEGAALRSKYFDGGWQAIQNIDTTTLSGKSAFDFEHGEIAGCMEGHIIYVDADGSTQWRERDYGVAPVWSDAEQLHGPDISHRGVGIVEHGSGWLWVIWKEANVLQYRVHLCEPEIWYPLLANEPLIFDVSADAVVTTSTVTQPNTPDNIPSDEAVPICWIGETVPATPCEVGWGILVEYSTASLKGILEIRQLTSTNLYARLEVGQDSVDLLGKADITHSVELLGRADITHSVELLGKFEAQATANLLGKADITHSVELLGKADITHSVELLGKADITHSVELLGKADITHSVELLGKFEAQATANLLCKADITHSVDLLGKADITHSVELLGKADITHSVELLGKADITHSEDLLGKTDVTHSVELLGKFEAQATANLLGKAGITHSVGLLGKFEAQATANLLCKVGITHSIDLLGRADITHSVELLGKTIIRHKADLELLGKCIIRHSDSKDLDANVEIVHWKDLYCKSIIRHTATPLNLPAIFWTRFPRRLWTSRRYINGVIELDEKLLGDAILEYVIEGVTEDTQGYLDNAGLSYSEWTDITLVPVQILRAVTYGTVAALYARHTLTFRSQVIPSITPVTVTVIGDAEKAMNYWEDRMEQMLEYYITSQGGDVMLTSTPDEEPVFSMEDIPEEVTEFVSWRIWLQERSN